MGIKPRVHSIFIFPQDTLKVEKYLPPADDKMHCWAEHHGVYVLAVDVSHQGQSLQASVSVLIV